MTDRRPLPDSEEVQDRRRNQRIIRWTTIIMVVIMASLAVLLGVKWILES